MTDPSPNDVHLFTEAVNAHGIFFKRAVRNALEEVPGVRILGEEFPVHYLEGASLDLLVGFNSEQEHWILPIECKKAYTAMKHWIFFEDPDPEPPGKMIYYFKENDILSAHLENPLLSFPFICIEGIEIDTQRIRKGPEHVYKSGYTDTIWKAAFQVCKGGLGFLLNEMNLRKRHAGSHQEINFNSLLVIITNAPLSVCELNTQSVDILSGIHRGDMILKRVGWLLLRYPFTPSQTTGQGRLEYVADNYSPPEARGVVSKESIVVLNSAHLSEFFEMLSRFNMVV